MSQFRYRAIDSQGTPQVGIVEASDWELAQEYLTTVGLHSIEPGGPADRSWLRRQQLQVLRDNLDWKRLFQFLGALLLGASLLAVLVYWSHRRKIEIHGKYQVQGPRKPIRICFFVDGKPIFPNKRNSTITATTYRCRLTFFTWRRPQSIFARLRMEGYTDAAHQPVPINFTKPMELPPLTLHQQGEAQRNGKLPW